MTFEQAAQFDRIFAVAVQLRGEMMALPERLLLMSHGDLTAKLRDLAHMYGVQELVRLT